MVRFQKQVDSLTDGQSDSEIDFLFFPIFVADTGGDRSDSTNIIASDNNSEDLSNKEILSIRNDYVFKRIFVTAHVGLEKFPEAARFFIDKFLVTVISLRHE